MIEFFEKRKIEEKEESDEGGRRKKLIKIDEQSISVIEEPFIGSSGSSIVRSFFSCHQESLNSDIDVLL